MSANGNRRRTYGTGSIIEKNGHYYGQWRLNARLIKRKLGPIRKPGTREGMTKTMAESKLRSLIEDTVSPPPVVERMTVEEAGTRLIAHLATMRRKPSTTESYESYVRIHIGPYFASRPITQITKEDVESFAAACLDHGQSVKSTLNDLGLLHGIFEFAIRRGWATVNPVKLVEKPKNRDEDPDIRFLDQTELDALLGAVRDDDLGRVERVMYMSAAMTGMRQGELLALRWLDVDWVARRIRVRLNFVRGRTGTPKSKRSSRSVPLADVLGGELDLLHQQSAFSDDEDLVFAHPHTGKPIDRSKLLKRYKQALKRAGVRDVRFHDLRHTFGTHMAAQGVPMRTLQEWMGHRDFKTTLIYADYAPSPAEADLVNAAFQGINLGINLKESRSNSDTPNPANTGV
jgi:integrase